MRSAQADSPHLDDGLRLAETIKQLRVERGLSREALAWSTQVSRDTITKIERAETVEPGLFTVDALATGLGIELNELLVHARSRRLPDTPIRLRLTHGLVSVGYEGRSQPELLDVLAERHVTTVADVRLNPISRKQGLSKNSLRRALAEIGIAYIHLRELGNPRDNRSNFGGLDSTPRQRFQVLLQQQAAVTDLQALVAIAREQVVAVLCFEKDQEDCHRHIVINEARRIRPPLPLHRA